MYQTLGEKIDVAGVYSQAKFLPKKFRWRDKTYVIDVITLMNNFKDGGVLKRWYSVMAGGNVYRLCFDRDLEVWTLAEVWYEG